jgi:hypothetical protein
MQGGCIANIGSCKTGFNYASDLVQINEIRTKGLEFVNKKIRKKDVEVSFKIGMRGEILKVFLYIFHMFPISLKTLNPFMIDIALIGFFCHLLNYFIIF